MWQIYGMMALDLIKERHRTAEGERRARGARRLHREDEARSRARTGSLLIESVRRGHRA